MPELKVQCSWTQDGHARGYLPSCGCSRPDQRRGDSGRLHSGGAPKDAAAKDAAKAQIEAMLKTWRAPIYKDQARKMIDSMFSDKTTPAKLMLAGRRNHSEAA